MARPVAALDPVNLKNITRVKDIPGHLPLILADDGMREYEVKPEDLPKELLPEASRHSRLLAEWTARIVFGATGKNFDSYKDGAVRIYIERR